MISIATAWVLVTLIKHNKSVNTDILVVTGSLDLVMVAAIAIAFIVS